MRTLTVLTTALFLTSLASCDNQTSRTSASGGDTLINQKTDIADVVQTAQKPENTATDFLIWYRGNMDRLSSFQLVNNGSGENFDSTKFYSVNFQETEKYLNVIESSRLVSTAYLDYWKKYFVNADSQFRANPQNDGPPTNFDYDFVMQSQDGDEDLANIDKAKVLLKSIQVDTAQIVLGFPSGQKLKMKLRRQSQKWLIDIIENSTGR